MRDFRKFTNKNTFEADHLTNASYPKLCIIADTKNVHSQYNISHFIAKYNVQTTTAATQVLGSTFDLTQIYKMYIDDVEVEPVSSYTFATTGEHTIKCEFLNLTTLYNCLNLCEYLTYFDGSNLDTSQVTSLRQTFQACRNMTYCDVSTWDTSKVTSMERMWMCCEKLEHLDVSMFDMSNVTKINAMFMACYTLKFLDVSNWNTSNITDMEGVFSSNKVSFPSGYVLNHMPMQLSKIDVSKWDTSNVTTMRIMFQNCQNLNYLDVSNWDTSNVTDMRYMFTKCEKLCSLDVSNWNTSNVTNMQSMFNACYNIKIHGIGNFNMSNVTDTSFMFNYCLSINELIIPNWNLSKCTTVGSMFQGMHHLNYIDIRNVNLQNCSVIESIFNIYASTPGTPTADSAYDSQLREIRMDNVVPPTNNTDFRQIFDIPTTTKVYLPNTHKAKWQSIIAQMIADHNNGVESAGVTSVLSESQIVWV